MENEDTEPEKQGLVRGHADVEAAHDHSTFAIRSGSDLGRNSSKLFLLALVFAVCGASVTVQYGRRNRHEGMSLRQQPRQMAYNYWDRLPRGEQLEDRDCSSRCQDCGTKTACLEESNDVFHCTW